MKTQRLTLLIATMSCAALLLSACGSSTSNSSSVGGTGGDETKPAYICQLTIESNGVSKALTDYVDSKTPGTSEKWFQQFSHVNPNATRDPYDCNDLMFIQEMGLTREEVEKVNVQGNNLLFTTKEMDAIFSGDQKQINEVFVNPLAILVNGYIYTPEWVATHSPEDYKTVGITKEMLKEKQEKWNDYFGDDRKQLLGEHVDAFLNAA